MNSKSLIFLSCSIVALAAAAWFGAGWAVRSLETDTMDKVNASLNAAGQNWSSIETDGLIVRLNGEAPSETARFSALEVAARIVDTNRIIDQTTIKNTMAAQTPAFSVEILRNDPELSVIGLVPGKDGRIDVLQKIEPLKRDNQFTDLMESIEFDPPPGWAEALAFAIEISADLPKSRIVVKPGGVSVEAFFSDRRDSKAAQEAITAAKPDAIDLALDFNAPLAVVAPFRFVASLRDGALNVKECWSDSEASKAAIYTALSDFGAEADCPKALGAPSPEWANAVTASLAAIQPLQNADITITDMDVTLAGTETTDLAGFEAASETLQSTLPEFFSFNTQKPGHAAPPEPRDVAAPIFTASRATDGSISLNGPMRDTMSKQATENFASAQFGDAPISATLSVVGNVPPGWSPRVLAALDALSLLHDGAVEMTMDQIVLTGRSAQQDAPSFIKEALQSAIGATALTIDVAYVPELADLASQSDLDARECERQLGAIMTQAQIIFDPNSSTISGESELLLDEIAFIVTSCVDAKFEIGGHTDSQGREEMNLALSQARADAVMDALLSRNVLLDQLTAKGFGETEPIADNETEAGRTRNRRIAFKLTNDNEATDEQN